MKILWKYIKSSMIITDMPGTKDGDDEPRRKSAARGLVLLQSSLNVGRG